MVHGAESLSHANPCHLKKDEDTAERCGATPLAVVFPPFVRVNRLRSLSVSGLFEIARHAISLLKSLMSFYPIYISMNFVFFLILLLFHKIKKIH